MLTSVDLDRIPFDENVLELIPEVVARCHTVLPLRLGVRSLHVVLPNDTNRRIAETIETLERALHRELSYDLADRDLLAKIIDLHYSAMGSVVKNCPRTFAFQCSRRWVDLDRTGDDRIRHCNSCDTNVRLCKSDLELDAAIARGECVAFYVFSMPFLGTLGPDV